MCNKCLQSFKRNGLGQLTYGQVKYYAHQIVRGASIPVFKNRKDNIAIEAHAYKIWLSKTRKDR
jgi:hypothetical protein